MRGRLSVSLTAFCEISKATIKRSWEEMDILFILIKGLRLEFAVWISIAFPYLSGEYIKEEEC